MSAHAERKRKPKRGVGHGRIYSAYIQVTRNDFSSTGRSHVMPCPLNSGRVIDVLSDLERGAFLALLTFRPRDIREQYPLDLESGIDFNLYPESSPTLIRGLGTLDIAQELGIRHPPHHQKKRCMTTDFVVTLNDGSIAAIHCKWSTQLAQARNAELRKLEEEYWRSRGVRHVVVTEKSLPRRLINNLKWAMSAMSSDPAYRDNFQLPTGWLRDVFERNALQRYSMRAILESLVQRYGVSVEQQVVWLKRAVTFGLIPVDHSQTELNLVKPWKLLKKPAQIIELLEVS